MPTCFSFCLNLALSVYVFFFVGVGGGGGRHGALSSLILQLLSLILKVEIDG